MNLELLQKDIENSYKNWEQQIGNKDIFYKVFFSKFSYNADILFIGINPGAGEDGIKCSEPLPKFEYIDEIVNNYSLAQETLKVFEMAGYPNLLKELDEKNKVVKTNFFFNITPENTDLDSFRNETLGSLKFEFYEKSKDWIKTMIKLTNPKIIICEGAYAYKDNIECSINENITEDKSEGTIFYLKFENKDFTLLKYNRRSSRILDKSLFSQKLKTALIEHAIV